MFYVDTSVLVTALTSEEGTDRARQWLRRHENEDLRISNWVITEFGAALSMKVRMGDLVSDRRAATLQAFYGLARDSLGRLAIEQAHFVAAAQLCQDSASGLRAGDALHLAVAEAADATVCTLDKGMVRAGERAGIETVLLR